MSREERVRRALQALPRHRPGTAFRGRVMASLRGRRRRLSPSLALPAAAALLVAVLGGTLLRHQEQRRETGDLLLEISALREEQRRLRAELHDLGAPRPAALLLDADDRRDVVLDLRASRGEASSPAGLSPRLSRQPGVEP